MYYSFFKFIIVSHHISRPTVCFSNFPWFSVFLPYSRFYSVHFSFSNFFSVSCHIPGHTVFVTLFPRYSVFCHSLDPTVCISYSSSFSVFLTIFYVLQFVFLTFRDFLFSRHTPCPTVCISHFAIFECYSPCSRSYSLYFSFSI